MDDGGLMFWETVGREQLEFNELAQEFRKSFLYADGKVFWRKNKGRAKAGQEVFGVSNEGYRRVGFNRKVYLLHRVIYAMHTNDFPAVIDHIDGNKDNNKIENLRPATQQQNTWNARQKTSNKSGVKGVSWHKRARKWQAHIRTQDGNRYLGLYESIDEAEKAVTKVRSESHGAFSNNGDF